MTLQFEQLLREKNHRLRSKRTQRPRIAMHMDILKVLRREGPMLNNHIAAKSNMEYYKANGMLLVMEQKGLVKHTDILSHPNAFGRRAEISRRYWSITVAGVELLQRWAEIEPYLE